MQVHFFNNVIERADELRFMPKEPFRYYIIGFRDFILSSDFKEYGAPDAASCFLELIEEKLKNNSEHILPVMDKLMSAIDYVAKNQFKFDAPVDIYGKFSEKSNNIRSLYDKKRNG